MDEREDYDMWYHILVDGVPTRTDPETWAKWLENDDNRRVALTNVGSGVEKRTLLVRDHDF